MQEELKLNEFDSFLLSIGISTYDKYGYLKSFKTLMYDILMKYPLLLKDQQDRLRYLLLIDD